MKDSENTSAPVKNAAAKYLSRRSFLVSASAVAAAAAAWTWYALDSEPSDDSSENGWEDAFERLVSGSEQIEGYPITLDLPDSVDDGISVPYKVSIAPINGVPPKSLTIYCPGNPFPRVATFEFGPSVGVAGIKSKMRLGGPQELVLVADMGNGQMAVHRHFIDVLSSGC